MTRTQILGISIVAILFSACASSKNLKTSANIKLGSPWEITFKSDINLDSTINYLQPILLLKKYENNYFSPESKWQWLQAFPSFFSRISNKEDELKTLINQWRNWTKIITDSNALASNEGAINYLIEKCKNERVVMLNENHFAPNNRILASILLDSLAKYGFNYFAAEAIFDSNLNNRNFANANSGFYTREPMFANLIRKAVENGYNVFGYDYYTNNREKEEAQNIYEQTFARDTAIKLFVYAGFGHIIEQEQSNDNKMAREFFLMSGIDPLSIEQTEYLTDAISLIVIDTVNLKNRRMKCDISIANNISYDWYAERSGYLTYEIFIDENIANQAIKDSLMFVVSVCREEEYKKDKTAIPVYNYLLDDDATKIYIKLPKDKYVYLIKNRLGDVVYEGNF
jgi:hypothetical protein